MWNIIVLEDKDGKMRLIAASFVNNIECAFLKMCCDVISFIEMNKIGIDRTVIKK